MYMYCTNIALITINVGHILGCWRLNYLVQRVDFSSAVTMVLWGCQKGFTRD